MSYLRSALAPGEEVLFRGRLHWILWLRAWAELIVLGVLIVGIVLFVRDVVALTNTEVAVTNRRLMLKTGLLERHTNELELTSVEAIQLDQSVWGRVLGFGRVNVHGTGEAVWTSPLIANPVGFRREIEIALSAISSAG